MRCAPLLDCIDLKYLPTGGLSIYHTGGVAGAATGT